MKIVNLFFCLSLVGGVVACSGSDSGSNTTERKAQSRAESLVDEQNSLVSQLRAMGMPRLSWTESELHRFESLLDQLESVEGKLGNLNGTNGIAIHGNNVAQIPKMRALLEAVRAGRSSSSLQVAPARPNIPIIPKPTSPSSVENPRLSELKALIKDYKQEYGSKVVKDISHLSYEETVELIAVQKEHKANLGELNDLLAGKIRKLQIQSHSNNNRKVVADSMILMIKLDIWEIGSDLNSVTLSLKISENQRQRLAEDYLMSLPVETGKAR